MPTPMMIAATNVALRPAPINPDWVIDGEPIARNAELFRSKDGLACTLVWDCTPGRFRWIYDIEETIHVLEGSIVLDDGDAPPRRYGPGDVVFFPAGACVQWTVETHVRKLAFFRRPLPKTLALASATVRRIKSGLRGRVSHHSRKSDYEVGGTSSRTTTPASAGEGAG